ncbi:hypothetical protein ACEN9X_09465 [Mucilaginibacter sp. Mucisp86]|uniref:hypothetical protein n=1 Tax=Mucilaginibacter sp. Mucisp86 TaxID=3243060 RepID=UPI0039B5BDA7
MDFKNYQESSIKHLSTCKSILHAIHLLHTVGNTSADILQPNNTQATLHNVFYLSGYTLESIINYSIFKHYRWTKPSVQELDHTFSGRCDFTFFPHVPRRNGGTYQYWASQHEFHRNIDILKREFSSCGLPLIDRTAPVDNDAKKLFFSWNVEVRYHLPTERYSGVELTFANVKKFVELTDILYNGLMKIVG